MNYYEVVTEFLKSSLKQLIKEREFTLSDLKILLLICYHQLIEQEPNKLINGLLISCLQEIVDIEDENILESATNTWNINKIEEYITAFIHPRIKKLTGDNNQ